VRFPRKIVELRQSSRSGRLAFVASLVVFFVVAGATAALAHYVYEQAEVWDGDGGRCLLVRSEISHGNGGGYSKGSDLTYQQLGPQACLFEWDRGPGYLRVRYNLLKWTGTQYGICKSVDWVYNGSTANIMDVYTYWGTTPPCGTGIYGTATTGQVKYNGSWYGGRMWSGVHTLPPP